MKIKIKNKKIKLSMLITADWSRKTKEIRWTRQHPGTCKTIQSPSYYLEVANGDVVVLTFVNSFYHRTAGFHVKPMADLWIDTA